MDVINEWLASTVETKEYSFPFLNERFQLIRPRLICKDGFSMSVQASQYHYCKPRVDGVVEYEEVEIGPLNEKEELLIPYAENPDETYTVYPYVPIDIINQVIEKHGGIKEDLYYDIQRKTYTETS